MDVDLSSAPSWRFASPGGFGLMPLVFLSLLSIFGSCACGVATAGAASVRFVYSYLEKSGWNSCTTASGGFFSLLEFLYHGFPLVFSAPKVWVTNPNPRHHVSPRQTAPPSLTESQPSSASDAAHIANSSIRTTTPSTNHSPPDLPI